MSSQPETKLLAQAIAAAGAGEEEEARLLLRRVTELEPANVQGWIWRARVADTSADKIAFLEEALSLEPSNEEAQLALERITQREEELIPRLDEDEVLFCTIHPDRETMLRCNRCGRPMCTECAVRHPVGLRCRECVAETRSPIYQVDRGTAARAFGVALLLAVPVGLLVLTLGNLIFALGLFFGLIIGFVVGGTLGRAISEAVQRAVPRKRGRTVQAAVAAGMVLGTLAAAGGLLLVTGALPNPILFLLFLGSAVPAAVAALR